MRFLCIHILQSINHCSAINTLAACRMKGKIGYRKHVHAFIKPDGNPYLKHRQHVHTAFVPRLEQPGVLYFAIMQNEVIGACTIAEYRCFTCLCVNAAHLMQLQLKKRIHQSTYKILLSYT